MNPLVSSNEQIAVIRLNVVEPHRAKYADEVAAAARRGEEFVIPRIQAEDELDLYVKLQLLLVETLSAPQFHQSAAVMGDDNVAPQRCQEVAPTGAEQNGGGGDLLALHAIEQFKTLRGLRRSRRLQRRDQFRSMEPLSMVADQS